MANEEATVSQTVNTVTVTPPAASTLSVTSATGGTLTAPESTASLVEVTVAPSTASLTIASKFAPIHSPVFTGAPLAPTASVGTNNTQIATTQYVTTAVGNLIDSAPGTLDTLNEIAASLNDDASFHSTITSLANSKLSLSGGTMTGDITMSGSQTVDGRDLSVDGAKLDGIDAGAKDDQTAAEIRALVASASDSNVFTDADHSKLDGISASANNYVHPTDGTGVSPTLSGANVLATLTSDSLGHITAATARTLTLANLGYTGATDANKYVHPTHTQRGLTLASNEVLASFTSDTSGHVTGITKRTLTLANLGYTGATDANNYVLPLATSGARGGVKIGYVENGKNYPVELSSEKMFVNVPWTDTKHLSLLDDVMLSSVGDGELIVYNSGAWHNKTLTEAGILPLAGGTMTGNIVLNDGVKAIFGTSSDGIELYHASNESYIDDSGTGRLFIRSNGSGVFLQKTDGENLAKFKTDGPVELYHDNSKKFETTSAGATLTGDLTLGDSHFIGDDSFDNLTLISSSGENVVIASANDIYLKTDASGGGTGTNRVLINESGTSISSGTLKLLDGTGGSPSLTFSNGLDTGFYRSDYTSSPQKDQVNLSIDGNTRFKANEAGIWSVSGNIYFANGYQVRTFQEWLATTGGSGYGFKFRNTADGIDSAVISNIGELTLKGNTSPSKIEVYETFTDSSNYERSFFKHASSFLEIGTEAAGTGTASGLKLKTGGNDVITIGTDQRVKVGGGTNTPSLGGGTVFRVDMTQGAGNYASIAILGGNTGRSSLFFGDLHAEQRGALDYRHGDDSLSISTAAGERMRILSDGKVGIGTTSPARTLSVVSGSGIVSTFTSSTSEAKIFYKASGTSGDYHVGTGASGDNLILLAGTSERMRVASDGKIGINDTVPQGKLQIDAGGDVNAIHLVNSGQSFSNFATRPISIIFGDEQKGASARHQASINCVREAWSSTPAALTFKTATGVNTATERMRILSDGKVGIGTTSVNAGIGLQVQNGDFYVYSGNIKADNINAGYFSSTRDLELQGGASAGVKLMSGATTVLQTKSDGKVGIGTTTPTAQLHVHGSAGSIRVHSSAGGANLYLESQSSSLSRVRWNGVSNFAIRDDADGVDRLTINTDGNTTLAGNLTVQGNISTTGTFTIIDTDVSTTEQLLVTNNGTGPAAVINQTGVQPIVDFQDDSTSVFYIKNGGNVGVGNGITNPLNRLHVETSDSTVARFKSTTNKASILIQDDDTDGYFSAESERVSMGFNSGLHADNINIQKISGPEYRVGIGTASPSAKLHVAGGNILVDLQYGIRFADANTRIYTNAETPEDLIIEADQDLLLTPDGNVGIGYTSPSHPLHVRAEKDGDYVTRITNTEATAGANYGLKVDGGSNASDVALEVSSLAGTHLFEVRGDGNVGIGITDPDQKLDVNGNIRIPNQGKIVFGSAGAASDYLELRDVNTSGDLLKLVQDGNTRFTITGVSGDVYMQGDVGIGTTSPSAKLEIADTSPVLRITDQTNASFNVGDKMGSIEFYSDDDSGTSANSVRASISCVAQTTFGSSNGLSFATKGDVAGDPVERLRIDHVGRVGIGTTSPSSLLNLSDASNNLSHQIGFSYVSGGTETDAFTIGRSSSTGNLEFHSDINNHGFEFKHNAAGTQEFNILNMNVGIGTDAPSQKLDISAGNIELDTAYAIQWGGTANRIWGSGGNNYIKIETNGVERLRVDGQGDVGINETNPAEKLHVKGNARVGYSSTNGHLIGSKAYTITHNFTTGLTVSLAHHTACHVKVFITGNWGNHSSLAYVGEFIIQNAGDTGYNEPGIILTQQDNLHSDSIAAKIVDPTTGGGSPNDFTIQFQAVSDTSESISGRLCYHIMGDALSVS